MKLPAATTPIVLLLLAAGATTYAYVVDRGSISDADRGARRRDVFPSFRVDEVTRVAIEQPGDALVIERGPDREPGRAAWQMTSPRRESADEGAVAALLRELDMARRLRDVDPAEASGLDAPRLRASVALGPITFRFALGADASRPEGGAYLRVEGEGTMVVARSLKVQLLRGSDAYRERALVPYGAGDVARIEVRGPAGSFALERSGGEFRVAGSGLRASRSAVDRVLAGLSGARAESFVADDVADRGLAADALSVTVTPRDAARPPILLRLGGACPQGDGGLLLVRLTPTRTSACVARTVATALAQDPADLPDTSPFFARFDEMEELRLERPGGGPVIDLARRGNGWHQRAPVDRDLSTEESDAATSLAAALADARGQDPRRGPGPGAERWAPEARVTVLRTGGGTSEVVELAATAGGQALVRRLDDGATLRLPRALARRFEPHPAALRARAVWRQPVDAGEVVSVESTCGPSPARLDLHDGTWSLRAPGPFPADPTAASDLCRAFAGARAEAWLTEGDDGAFGLAAPTACGVTLALAQAGDAGARRVTLTFGDATQGGYFARASDDPAVFVASATLRALAEHPPVDGDRLHLDPATLASLSILRGAERRPVRLDGGVDDGLVRALGSLRAQAALHTGPPAAAEGLAWPALVLVASARRDGGAPVETRVSIGAPTRVDEADGYFARVTGVDATFFVARAPVDALLAP